jgi:acyl carrier protein
MDRNLLLSRLKMLVVAQLAPDTTGASRISDEEPLMGGKLCLDSLDALELAICIEEEFGIGICGEKWTSSAFATMASLADFLGANPMLLQAKVARPKRVARIAPNGHSLRRAAVPPPAWQLVFGGSSW